MNDLLSEFKTCLNLTRRNIESIHVEGEKSVKCWRSVFVYVLEVAGNSPYSQPCLIMYASHSKLLSFTAAAATEASQIKTEASFSFFFFCLSVSSLFLLTLMKEAGGVQPGCGCFYTLLPYSICIA